MSLLASPSGSGATDLAELSLEDLLNLEVTIVSKRPELLARAPAAIHVITREDIRRSGARNLPDLFRQAPGVQVAQEGSHTWAVSARGFNDTFANKLLVMIDGRTIYTPLFSGVFWDMQHTLIEDIERIEIVRGPGATLWGANAVNGVINIITSHARDTQGSLLVGGAGDHERGFVSFRHGNQMGDDGFFRVWGQFFDRDGFPVAEGGGPSTDDSWKLYQGGFRSDWEPSATHHLTVQGDIYEGKLNDAYWRADPDPITPPAFLDEPTNSIYGLNVLGRLNSTAGTRSEWTFQTYFDHTVRDTSIFKERRHTFDVDFQQSIEILDYHLLTWGGGYRLTDDQVDNTLDIALDPPERTDHLFSFFVQDEIDLIPDRLVWTLGTKFEHNDYTGFEVQPGTRLSWTPAERHTFWGSVARAVRTPSRAEHDIQLVSPDPATPPITGSRDFESEELIALEAGYRTNPTERFSVDLALFFNFYDNLRSREVQMMPGPTLVAGNELFGETYGGEIGATWRASEIWRLHGSYSVLLMNLRAREGSTDEWTVDETEGTSPQRQWVLRSSLDLPQNWEWDTWFRYVDAIERPGQWAIDSYLEMDMRLARSPWDGFEIALVGRNLLKSSHQEFGPSFVATQPREVPRSYYAKLTWRF